MLLQFSVSNFRALRGLQTLNLAASNYDKSLIENTLSPDLPGLKGKRWLKSVAIYGANASGKTTVIEAMGALSEWVALSAKTTDPEEPIPYVEPFALDESAAQEPTAFAIVFAVESVRYEYRVAATSHLVVHESLRAWPNGKEQVWFERNWNPQTEEHDFSPENPTGLPRNRTIEQRTLRNMLYLSKAVAENRSELFPAFRWLIAKLKFMDLGKESSSGKNFTLKQLAEADEVQKSKIIQILKQADLGIVDAMTIEGTPPDSEILKIIEAMSPDFMKMYNELPLEERRSIHPQLIHAGPNNSKKHLDWKSESKGTQRLFSLIGRWLDILNNGNTICIDEIETSMHPIMVRELLKLVFDETENTGGAQVIFTTHNPLFLDGSLLRRDQIWFTDKDDEGAAHLYPLTDYQPRQGESLIRGYMAGRYGAVPFVPRGLLGSFPCTEAADHAKEGENG